MRASDSLTRATLPPEEDSGQLPLELAALLAACPDGIVVLDASFVIRRINPAVQSIFGYEASELVGGSLDKLIPESLRARHAQHLAGMRAAPDGTRQMGSWRQITALHADGHAFPMMASIGKRSAGDQVVYIVFCRDMSGPAAEERRIEGLTVATRSANHRAEIAAEARGAFLAHLSHELRTPLNAILGFSELLDDQMFGPLGNDIYREYVGDIRRAGQSLLALLDRMLRLSRFIGSRDELRARAVDLRPLLDDVVDRLAPRARKALIRLDAPPMAVDEVWADPGELTDALIELVATLLNESEPDAHITLSAANGPLATQILIVHRGAPLPGWLIDSVSETLDKLGNAHLQNRRFAGLGFAYARLVVEAHAGDISVLRYGERETQLLLQLPRSPAWPMESRASAGAQRLRLA